MAGLEAGTVHRSEGTREQRLLINRAAHRWNRRVTRALKQLGNKSWPATHRLGIIPAPQFRLRHESHPLSWVWWIEHDIAPYDLFQCVAYEVELSLDEKGEPRFRIRSGAGERSFSESDLASLERVLSRVGQEQPLIIPRDFGPANE